MTMLMGTFLLRDCLVAYDVKKLTHKQFFDTHKDYFLSIMNFCQENGKNMTLKIIKINHCFSLI